MNQFKKQEAAGNPAPHPLHIRHVDEKMDDFALVQGLMERAFPESERVPFSYLLVPAHGEAEFLAFYDEETFCALAWIYNWKDLSFLFYFAVEDSMRGKGCGSRVLSQIKEMKAGRRLVLDIEPVDESAENYEQRRRRFEFYQRNGFHMAGVSYHWQGADFDLLIHEGSVTKEEVYDLYRHIMESWDDAPYDIDNR